MEKIVQTLSLFLILTVLYLGFTSCEREEKSPLVGEWSFSNNTNRYYTLFFYENGIVKYQEHDGGQSETSEIYHYIYEDDVLIIRYENGEIRNVIKVISLDGKSLVLKDWPNNGENSFYKKKKETNKGQGNDYKKGLVGTWSYNGKRYYYLSDGYGYVQEENKYDGIYREAFEWNIKDSILSLNYLNDDFSFSYIISSISKDTMLLKDYDDYYKRVFQRINSIGTTTVDYKKPPFTSYICIYGYYYELSKVVSRCYHGAGTESNSKHLTFFGSNGEMEPIGAHFMYFTPYYEGINKDWYDGTYILNEDSGYWTYGGVYCNKNSWSLRCEGKLKIKSMNNYIIYDFNMDDGDAIGHFEGTLSYN